MKRLLQYLAICLFCGLLIMLILSRISYEGASDGEAKWVPSAIKSVVRDPASNEVSSRGKSEQTSERVKELEKMALNKKQRDQVAENTVRARKHLQFYGYIAWRKFIDAQMPVFEELRKQAALSPDKYVPCTICDAKGILELCVVCDHTGKCPTCRGKGRDVDGPCPVCLGNGKCFLCFGSGKMPCPFCQSQLLRREVITADTPKPPNEIPIN